MKQLGLIGNPLDHSFSKRYFSEKFAREQISGYRYDLFPLKSIEELPALLHENPDLIGLNVTIPYKEAVLDYLDETDPHAAAIGAVNTIVIKNQKLIGYNTDWLGFRETLSIVNTDIQRALILGTGGASKAIQYALTSMGVETTFVSRQPTTNAISYADLSVKTIQDHRLIINCSPLGTFPNTETFPPINYDALTSDHFLYDLVYNPEVTTFMQKGSAAGAGIKNGYEMLVAQAGQSWKLWSKI